MTSTMSEYHSAIALEVGKGLMRLDDICVRYGINPQELRTLMSLPAFINQVQEARAKFMGDVSTRVKTKAGYLLEAQLDTLGRALRDQNMTHSQRLGYLQTLNKVSGAEARAAGEGGPTGPSFSVKINLGPQVINVTGQVPTKPVAVLEGDAVESVEVTS